MTFPQQGEIKRNHLKGAWATFLACRGCWLALG